MEQLVDWFKALNNNGINSWISEVVGIVFILIIRYLLDLIIKKRTENKRIELFLTTIINLITSFILILYLFNYLEKTSFIYKTLFSIGGTNITIILFLTIIFSVTLAVQFSKALREFIMPLIYDKYGFDKGLRASTNTILNYSIILVSVIVSLSAIGFSLNRLNVFTSVVGVGLGFGLQNLLSNFISGLIILFGHPIRVGDRIVVEDQIATVEDIKIRATIVRTRNDEIMIIPNSYFLEEKFYNRTYTNPRLRVFVELEVAYGSDVELVQKLLLDCVYELKNEKWPEIIDKPIPRVFFQNFGDSGLEFSVWFWIDSQTDEKEFMIPSDLRFKIDKKFSENNIEIPFPQRDIHIIK